MEKATILLVLFLTLAVAVVQCAPGVKSKRSERYHEGEGRFRSFRRFSGHGHHSGYFSGHHWRSHKDNRGHKLSTFTCNEKLCSKDTECSSGQTCNLTTHKICHPKAGAFPYFPPPGFGHGPVDHARQTSTVKHSRHSTTTVKEELVEEEEDQELEKEKEEEKVVEDEEQKIKAEEEKLKGESEPTEQDQQEAEEETKAVENEEGEVGEEQKKVDAEETQVQKEEGENPENADLSEEEAKVKANEDELNTEKSELKEAEEELGKVVGEVESNDDGNGDAETERRRRQVIKEQFYIVKGTACESDSDCGDHWACEEQKLGCCS